MIGRNDPCWCGSGDKWKKCHYPDAGPTPTGDDLSKLYFKKYQILLKTPEQIAKIRRACQFAKKCVQAACAAAKPGVTTRALDHLVAEMHKEIGATSASLGYGTPPFPAHMCTSLNDVICHGIPNDQPLREGEIMNIDVGTIVDGYYGDTSAMVCIGKVSEEATRVVDVSYECLMRSIAICKPGVSLSEIGRIIEEHAVAHRCSVVDQFVGHGVGIRYHEAPQVLHCRNHLEIPLVSGMTFTIEPMINAGVRDGYMEEDGWTVRTVDGKPSAQWEHTILITPTGYEILTA